MKKFYFLITLAIVFSALSANGQKPIYISEDSVLVGNSLYPGITVTIPEVDFNKTLKNWIKEQESGTKSKVVTDNGEMSIFGAIRKDISPNPINIYSILQNEDTLQYLMVSIELKKDQFVEPSSGDIQMTAARNFLKDFAKNQYIDFIKDEVAAQEKILRELNNELNGLQKNESKTKKGALSSKNVIRDEQDKLIVRNNELNQLSTEIINQNNLLISMDAGPGREAKAAQIKELDKRKSKLQREIQSADNKISKSKSKIDQADRALPRNDVDQQRMNERIGEQEAVVRRYMDKLNTVRNY